MKKLLTVTCLAGLLSIPSVVFADEAEMPAEPELSPEMQGHIGDSHSGPVWYGSIRAGVDSDKGKSKDGVGSFGSRWGVKGSSEVSEGLTAVYKFEEYLDATNATVLDGNRLSYVGLSGGFGTVTIGQVWSATYNTVGAITDKSTVYGDSGAHLRLGSAISYAVSSGNMSMQVDAILDSNKSGNTVDQLEFGVSMDVSDTGKIAFAHRRIEDYTVMVDPGTYKSMSEVMESAVLKSTNIVTGGTVTNGTLDVSDVVGTNGTLVVSDVVGTNGTLVVSDVDLEGSVSLPVSGGVDGLDPETAQARVAAVQCIKSDGTIEQKLIAKTTAAEICGDPGSYDVGSTIIDPNGADSLVTAPTIAIGDDGASIDASNAVLSGASYTVGTGDTAKTYPVYVRTVWTGAKVDGEDVTGAAATAFCTGTTADVNRSDCKEHPYYSYDVTGTDGTVTTNNIEGDDKVKKIKISGDLAMDTTTLDVTGGKLDGDISVTGGVLSGDISVTGGVLSGNVSATPVDVDTTTIVLTDPEIETTTTKDAMESSVVPGTTTNFIAGQMTLGGITGFLGYTEEKTNGSSKTDSTTHAGIRGIAGDTGVSYFVQLRNKETSSPWLIGLSKTLGGGASINFELADDDLANVKSKSALWLQVDF